MVDKRCSKCKQNKPIADFSKDVSRKDGLCNNCKQCRQEINKKNKEYKNHVSRIWYNNNKDKANIRRKNWDVNNPEKVALKRKNYAKYNKEKLANKNHLRRAKLLGNGIFKINKKELLKMYNSNCFYCGSNKFIQLDHIIPISRGGRHSIGNLLPACRKCNASKNNKFIVEWKFQGF